jgi:hypothetical protein
LWFNILDYSGVYLLFDANIKGNRVLGKQALEEMPASLGHLVITSNTSISEWSLASSRQPGFKGGQMP